MIGHTDFDVCVIGAGPAGSSAAFHLAQKGWRVALLEKNRMPRVKACGDGLGTGSVAMLHDMGVAPRLSGFQRVLGVDIRVDGEPSCSSAFQSGRGPGYGLVVPRDELDALIALRAREMGSAWFEGCRVTGFVFRDGRISGVRYLQGREVEMRTRFVVVADGGNSGLGARAGIDSRSGETVGYAVRGYFSNVPPLPDTFRICIPITDLSSGRPLPGYGWLFPLGGSRANIGVGFYPSQSVDRRLNLRHVFTKFLQQLGAIDPRMSHIRLEGPWIGGPLRSGMDPSRCVGNGAILVGDAAGLVDPFTGEGIDTALVSGKFAAEALDTALTRDDPEALKGYGELLEQRYRDRFQLGERFVRTYSFMWKLLQTTTDQRGVFFDTVRRALFAYSDAGPDADTMAAEPGVDAFQRRVQSAMKRIAGDDFPVFARICVQMQDREGAKLRQALSFWSFQLGGAMPDEDAVLLTAGLELTRLAHSVQTQVISGDPGPIDREGTTNRWGNSFAIMSSNYLLTRAFSTIHDLGADCTKSVAATAARVCALEIEAALAQPEGAGIVSSLRDSNATEIEGLYCAVVCRLSARLGRCQDAVQKSLDDFGMAVGAASFRNNHQARVPSALKLMAAAEDALERIASCQAKSELLAIARTVTEGISGRPPAPAHHNTGALSGSAQSTRSALG